MNVSLLLPLLVIKYRRERHKTIESPTTEENETALKKLKNNKAPGTSSIPPELLMFGSDRLKQWLKHIFASVRINEEIPKYVFKEVYVHCIRQSTSWNVLTIEASLC